MLSGVGKKIGDATVRSICDGLKRRSTSCLQKLLVSDAVNVNRVSDFLLYKSSKEHAMNDFGMRLDDFESVKEQGRRTYSLNDAEAETMAFETLRMYSTSIALEKIANASLKASKTLDWSCKKISWGNIADEGFKPSNRTRKSDLSTPAKYDSCARDDYVVEASGISDSDFEILVCIITDIFKVLHEEARIMAGQVIAIEKIIDAAFKASQYLSLYSDQQEKPTEATDNKTTVNVRTDSHNMNINIFPKDREEPTAATDNRTTLNQETSTELASHIDVKTVLRWGCEQPWLDDFMESRDAMSIFMDSNEARERWTEHRSDWVSTSSSIKDWTRIDRFMEFKARKEYAMEAYGVRLGDFQSLKKAALMLFEITEAEAENLASETMASDSESIAFEKIADVAFKASKILNWTVGKKKKHSKLERAAVNREKLSKTWHGDIADAGGFKSPQSMKNYRKNMKFHSKNKDVEACKAYTMEAFGVSLVDIDILKHFAMSMFYTYVREQLSEEEAVMMACQTVAIDKIVDALSENLNLNFQVWEAPLKNRSHLPHHWSFLITPGLPDSVFCFPGMFDN